MPLKTLKFKLICLKNKNSNVFDMGTDNNFSHLPLAETYVLYVIFGLLYA